MAVNAYKQIWTFSSSNAGDWSEVFYKQAATLEQAQAISRAHMSKRLDLLSSVCYLEKVRTSEITNLRNAGTKNYGRQGQWDTGNPQVDAAACVVQLTSKVIPSSRKWWMRGINNDFVSRDAITGREVLTPLASGALQSFLDSLEANQYMVLPKINQAAIGNPPNPVTQVDGTTNPGFAILTTKNAAAFLAGQIIIASQFSKKDLPGLSGQFKVIASAGNLVTINYTTPTNATIVTVTGKLSLYQPNVGAIISGSASAFAFYGDHQTKNVLTGSRGARSAARVRHSR